MPLAQVTQQEWEAPTGDGLRPPGPLSLAAGRVPSPMGALPLGTALMPPPARGQLPIKQTNILLPALPATELGGSGLRGGEREESEEVESPGDTVCGPGHNRRGWLRAAPPSTTTSSAHTPAHTGPHPACLPGSRSAFPHSSKPTGLPDSSQGLGSLPVPPRAPMASGPGLSGSVSV